MSKRTSQDTAMRIEFEAWAKTNRRLDCLLRTGETYAYTNAARAWEGWQAAHATMQQRLAENAEIVAVYDKLHKHNVVGAHWLWVVVAQAAESGDAEQAAREYGFSRADWLPIATAPAGGEILAAIGDRVTVVIKSMGEFFDQCGMPDAFDRLPKCKPSHWMPLPAAPQASEVNNGAASLNSGAAKED